MKSEKPSDKQPEALDPSLLRQLVRQLKIINFWISLYGTLLLIALGIILFLMFQVFSFVRDTNDRIDQARDSVNIQRQACQSDGAFGDFLRSRSGLCD